MAPIDQLESSMTYHRTLLAHYVAIETHISIIYGRTLLTDLVVGKSMYVLDTIIVSLVI